MKNLILLLPLTFLFVACGGLKGVSPVWKELTSQTQTPAEQGATHFMYSDFYALNEHSITTNTLPWKLTAASLLYDKRHLPVWKSDNPDEIKTYREQLLKQKLTQFGFFYPKSIANAPESLKQPKQFPLGLFKGAVEGDQFGKPIKFEAAGLSCMACHSSRGYDSQGYPTDQVWLGAPNGSFDPELYTQNVYKGLKNVVSNKKQVYNYIKSIYPEMDEVEKESYRYALGVSETAQFLGADVIYQRIKELVQGIDSPLPFSNGAPGLTNGVGSLKSQLGLVPEDHYNSYEAGFTSIPNIFDREFRSSLLYDGVYYPKTKNQFSPVSLKDTHDSHIYDLAEIVTHFTVPTAGNHPTYSRHGAPQAYYVLKFLSTAQRPRFPGYVDIQRAKKGAQLYEQNCASCHGDYNNSYIYQPKLVYYPNKALSLNEIGSDIYRAKMIDKQTEQAIAKTRISQNANFKASDSYVATILSGLWMSAPYMHNGSVPTLWAFMNPEQRPKKFYVGGHRLNYEEVGIEYGNKSNELWSYSGSYEPWSEASVYDTAQPGKSNKGHERQFENLEQNQKRDLLEYLKLL
ncbi:MAG: c-type cytochrome [Bdellovibrionales bacterium]|nr:c-type cytochrome [Bdellovibrionales bacterium]